MVTNRKNTGKAASIPSGLAFGVGISLLVTLLLAIFLAHLVDGETILWENIGYGILVLIILASFLGSMAAYRKIRRQRFMVCMLSGLIYFCILLSITALFFGGQYQAVFATAMLVLAGSSSAWLLGLKENRGGMRKNKISRYR